MSAAMNIEMASLRMEGTGRLHRALTGATALHETGFFRDREMFDALRVAALPRIIAANASVRRLRVWCAACSTGQEAYSVAMLLQEHFTEGLAGWDVKIVATDMATEAVEYARKARYRREDVNRGLPAKMLVRYFARDGEEWEAAPELRTMCEFGKADVCAIMGTGEAFDLVLMRNVLLFLPAQDRATAFANVHKNMAAHGVLALGQSEQAEDSTDLFEPEFVLGCCFYRMANKV